MVIVISKEVAWVTVGKLGHGSQFGRGICLVNRREDKSKCRGREYCSEISRPTPIMDEEEDSMRTTFNTAAVALVVGSRRQRLIFKLSHYFLLYTIIE